MKKSSTEDGYYILYTVITIVLWGLVPSFAKMGNLPGGLTTMYVNWFAVIGVVAAMFITGSIREIGKPQPYGKLVLVGLIWPLLYSIFYFTSIDKGSPSLTTIANYFWPIFYLVLASLFAAKKFSGKNWLVVLVGVLAVAIPTILGESITLILLPLGLALGAAFLQALYSLVTEKFKEDAWLITFVVEVVTAVGATIYVVLFEHFVIPDLATLGYMAFIGVLANGVGFWAFLKASQESSRSKNTKTVFLALMCLIPLVQVVLLPILGIETINQAKWIGVILIVGALLYNRLSPSENSE